MAKCTGSNILDLKLYPKGQSLTCHRCSDFDSTKPVVKVDVVVEIKDDLLTEGIFLPTAQMCVLPVYILVDSIGKETGKMHCIDNLQPLFFKNTPLFSLTSVAQKKAKIGVSSLYLTD